MTKLRTRWSTSVRIALALAIAVVNAALFANATSAAVPPQCKDCIEMPGGALGTHASCQPGGDMDTCRARLMDCVGYGCGAEPIAEAVFEALPAELTAN